MSNSDWTELVTEILSAGASQQGAETLASRIAGNVPEYRVDGISAAENVNTLSARGPVRSAGNDIARQSSTALATNAIASSLASDLKVLLAHLTPENQAVPGQLERRTNAAEQSVAGTVLKTAGLVTGIGPLATGLLKLFGGRSEEEQVPGLVPFARPESVRVDAGLSADRTLRPVSYSADGAARVEPPFSSAKPAGAPTIQVNVQAMDSRSFIDHSEQIAQAVREAMLHSHGLNDLISEL